MAHGGVRQKNFNYYEETLRVPLVYSNPVLWSKPVTSQMMVSHVDFLPTLASLVDAPRSARANWQGVDYSDHMLERLAPPPQDYIVFTYDDYQAGQSGGHYVIPPQHIISLRERRWKIAEYYDVNGNVPSQWEMYDLKHDPLERINLAHHGHKRPPPRRNSTYACAESSRGRKPGVYDHCPTPRSRKRREARTRSRHRRRRACPGRDNQPETRQEAVAAVRSESGGGSRRAADFIKSKHP